jgi:hypothetical protein
MIKSSIIDECVELGKTMGYPNNIRFIAQKYGLDKTQIAAKLAKRSITKRRHNKYLRQQPDLFIK